MKNDSLLQAIACEEAQLADLTHKRNESRKRLDALKTEFATLDSTPVTPTAPAIQPVADTPTTADGKISLFHQLFRGRNDVFPLLWVSSKTGRKGYSPTCSNEWVRGVCEKPRVKCSECPNQAFLPLNDQVILEHLQGRRRCLAPTALGSNSRPPRQLLLRCSTSCIPALVVRSEQADC